MRARPAGFLALASALVATSPALGQPAASPQTEARRRQWIVQSQAAADAGDHARAVTLAERAAEIRATPSLWQLIAAERMALGQSVGAHEAATECVLQAATDPASSAREEQIAACHALIAALEPALGLIQLRLPDPPPAGLRLRVAGREVPPTRWNAPLPVVPGTVEIDAWLPGRAPTHQPLQVGAGQRADATIAVLPPEPPRSLRPTPPRPAMATRPPARPSIGGPVVTMAAGAAGLGAAGVFFALRADALAACRRGAEAEPTLYCSAEQLPAIHTRAETWNTATNVALVTGATVLGLGTLWLVWSYAMPARARSPQLTVLPSRDQWLVRVGGTF